MYDVLYELSSSGMFARDGVNQCDFYTHNTALSSL